MRPDAEVAGEEPVLRRRNSREALVAAALAEFSEKGYELATVTDIAERAGVTTGALYAHFKGKLDLLLQALGIVPASAVYRELAEVAARPPTEVWQVLGRTMADAPDASTLLLLDAAVAARRDPAVARALRDGLAEYEEAIVRATLAGIALGLFSPALPAVDLTRVLNLLALGRLVAEAIGADPPSEAAYASLLESLLRSPSTTAVPGEELSSVRSCAEVLERARRDLADSVSAAVAAGHSLRQVGAAAGVSHERVRQMLRDA
jgi:AcrR family transcriptional regulator